mgnify:CR=1 FL=1
MYLFKLYFALLVSKKYMNKYKHEYLSIIKNFKINFAAKSLSNISILKFMKKLGAGLDTVSIEEVKIGLICGFNNEDITFTPNGVSFNEIEEEFRFNEKFFVFISE